MRLTHRQMEQVKAVLQGHRDYLNRLADERRLPPFTLRLRGQRAIVIGYGGWMTVEMPASVLLERNGLKRRGF